MLAERARMLKSDVLSTEKLMMHGQSIPLFSGVESWFDRIDRFAESIDLELEHYIISSGLDSMIRGTCIGNKFRDIYACMYHYSDDKYYATWPAQAINYTTKTQFLFRINKGIHNSWDNGEVNKFI